MADLFSIVVDSISVVRLLYIDPDTGMKTIVKEVTYSRTRRQNGEETVNGVELVVTTNDSATIGNTVNSFNQQIQNGSNVTLTLNGRNVSLDSFESVITSPTPSPTVTPTSSTTPPVNTPGSTTTPTDDGGLTSGAITGIILACLLGFLIVLVIAVAVSYFVYTRAGKIKSYSFNNGHFELKKNSPRKDDEMPPE
ncbi:PREDICTED: uncharacterized protein LOC109585349 [Amphimedon queenslandica]|uniref:Uncharacterized protein n=1 Tax=Amphimedon queenslandica TaxID=400682 RepID=A0AAN0JJU5_AMPQE|nr:PREDICTED: uncharacterized protein LOC109585349 [Amphimedon queenslandica]|eukprot:XP_019856953.1 PREDICTED: uncharacterized protein LOC109585349 [Amphimedon queenslandica]